MHVMVEPPICHLPPTQFAVAAKGDVGFVVPLSSVPLEDAHADAADTTAADTTMNDGRRPARRLRRAAYAPMGASLT